jgi:hypothetical protein
MEIQAEAYDFVQDLIQRLNDPATFNRKAIFQRTANRRPVLEFGEVEPAKVPKVVPVVVEKPEVRRAPVVIRPAMAGRGTIVRPIMHPLRRVHNLEKFREMLMEMQYQLPEDPLTSKNLEGIIDDEILDNLKSLAIQSEKSEESD